MLLLGKIKSEKGFDKIVPYTKTDLFHQAFVSLSMIDTKKTMNMFDKFLDDRSYQYMDPNGTGKHESGYNTLICILEENKEASKYVKKYSFSSRSKKKLVEDAFKKLNI